MATHQIPAALVAQCAPELSESLEDISTSSGSNNTSQSTTPLAAERSAPRKVRFCEEEGEEREEEKEHIFVKCTFLDLHSGSSLADRYKLFRKSKTDSYLHDKPEAVVYEPGKYSDDVQSRLEETMPSNQVAQEPLEQASHPASHFVMALVMQPAQASNLTQQAGPEKRSERTTVMMKNIPNNYTRDMFLSMLDEKGFKGLYDFAYLPCDFSRDANLGYSFVNLVSADAVEAFWNAFDGFSDWVLPTAKVCRVSWSGPHQGLMAHVERYRNSPVMHSSVRDDYKPMIYANGVRQPFPAPTKKIKAPGKAGIR